MSRLFDRMFAINVRAPFFLMQDAIKVMQREKLAGADRQHPVGQRLYRFGANLAAYSASEGRAADADQEHRQCRQPRCASGSTGSSWAGPIRRASM
jgi:NAD(P)-dependent dehydrogenase (short-subunit alcohol dehydrogenase family)